MQYFESYIREFLAIVTYCLDNNIGKSIKKDSQYGVEAVKIRELLDKNKYATSDVKLKFYRDMHWISADRPHLTKSIYDNVTAKSCRMVVFNLSVARELQKCLESAED